MMIVVKVVEESEESRRSMHCCSDEKFCSMSGCEIFWGQGIFTSKRHKKPISSGLHNLTRNTPPPRLCCPCPALAFLGPIGNLIATEH